LEHIFFLLIFALINILQTLFYFFMKKFIFAFGLAVLGLQNVSAQFLDPHFGVGVGVGTTGIAVDVSGTLNDYLGVRLGADIMPQIKIGTDLDLGIEDKTNGTTIDQMSQYVDDLNAKIDLYNAGVSASQRLEKVDKSMLPSGNLPKEIGVEGKLNNATFHFLIDAYPFGDASSFHVTAGAYFGPSKIIKVYNKEDGFMTPINQWNNAILGAEANPSSLLYTQVVKPNNLQMIGAELGDYFITTNPVDNGNVEASIKVSGFRPYVGIGFGRAVPKNRIGCQFDLGVQFWNSPEVVAPTYDKVTGKYNSDTTLEESNAGSDAGGAIKIISKISVYPCMTLRITGRIL
jgi:hypothetical protein